MEHEEIKIEYTTSGGSGCMTLNAEVFFPCGVGILKKLLKNTVSLCDWQQEEAIIRQIEDHCTRAIAETEEYKKLMPQFYAETKEHIPELEEMVRTKEQAVSNLLIHYKAARGKEKKELAEVVKKAKEDLKQAKAHLRNTEVKCNEYVRKTEEAVRKIELYKKDLEILKQRK